MWKTYVILALLTQLSNAQHGVVYTTTDSGKNTIQSSKVYSAYDYVTYLSNGRNNKTTSNVSQLSKHLYNTNSRKSYEGETKDINVNTAPQFANTPSAINLTITSPVFNETLKPLEIAGEESFNARLFQIMSSTTQYENLVYSPFSLQILLAFIFTMSDGKLYQELADVLAISNDRTIVAKTFENILQKTLLNTPPTTMIVANKLYYDFRFGPVNNSVRNFAKNSFGSDLEEIDFMASKKAANIINSWVSERTRNLINNIVTPSALASDSSALLVNSIYFKSDWLTKFATYDTEIQEFFVTKQKQVPVDMMYNEDVFNYGDFSEDLQATVVELPYKASDLVMMLILPKEIDGLTNVERNLKYFDLESITQKLKRETVTVKLPKFKIEFETDMIKPLQQLGLNALFNNAGSINLFNNQQKPLTVDQFKHKSFINVNEAGTEAAATTVAKYIPLSIPINMKYFTADHPFLFVIRDANTTYFIGHVVQF